MSKSLASKIKNQLEQDIIDGSMQPGERLEEISLAKRFGVSRTPIREALRALSNTGLVELRPQQGCFVAKISLEELLEIFEVMAELESLCARLASRRMTEVERCRLLDIHQSSKKAVKDNDREGYYAINTQLHDAIYRGSHNTFLYNQTQSLYGRLAPYRRMQLRRTDRLSESFSEHDDVVQAIVDRDAEKAEKLMRGHISIQPRAFHDFVAQLANDTA